MIIKNLYNPILDGVRYTGFINAVNSIKPIEGVWVSGRNAINLMSLDNVIKLRCGRRNIYEEYDGVTRDTYEKISDVLSSYKYELDGLFATLFFDYNPIDNYDRTETQSANNTTAYGETQTHNAYGENSINTNYGELVRVESLDGVTQTDNIGARTQTNNIGARSSSDTLGAENRTSTTSNSTSAFDGGDYDAKTDKTTTNDTLNERVNSHSENAVTDSVNNSSATDSRTTSARVDEYTTESHTDTITNSAKNDTVTNDAHTDTVNSGYELRAHGNIGTMSTQNMIEQERNVRMFNFYDFIIDIIYNEITTLNYEV